MISTLLALCLAASHPEAAPPQRLADGGVAALPEALLAPKAPRADVVLVVPGRGDVPMLQVMAEAGIPPEHGVYVKTNGSFVDSAIVDAFAEPATSDDAGFAFGSLLRTGLCVGVLLLLGGAVFAVTRKKR